jgi:hypothetical protein
MKEIKELYRNYPSSPEGLKDWEEKTGQIVEKAQNM